MPMPTESYFWSRDYRMRSDTMNLIARVKQSLMGDTDQETYEYQCEVCHATFESTEANAGAVGCPSCGGTRIRAAGR